MVLSTPFENMTIISNIVFAGKMDSQILIWDSNHRLTWVFRDIAEERYGLSARKEISNRDLPKPHPPNQIIRAATSHLKGRKTLPTPQQPHLRGKVVWK